MFTCCLTRVRKDAVFMYDKMNKMTSITFTPGRENLSDLDLKFLSY